MVLSKVDNLIKHYRDIRLWSRLDAIEICT